MARVHSIQGHHNLCHCQRHCRRDLVVTILQVLLVAVPVALVASSDLLQHCAEGVAVVVEARTRTVDLVAQIDHKACLEPQLVEEVATALYNEAEAAVE